MNQQQDLSFSLSAGGQEVQAEDSDEREILRLYAEAILLRRRKGQDYGKDTWRGLGLRGEFPYVWHKVKRLKTLIWDTRNPPNFESIRDNLLDVHNYVSHMLILLQEERGATSDGIPGAEPGRD